MPGLLLILVAFTLLTAVALLGGVVVAKSAARTAAEQAALASAARFAASGDEQAACDTARALASANGATLDECRADGEDMRVTATVRASAGFPVRARARAGPVDCTP